MNAITGFNSPILTERHRLGTGKSLGALALEVQFLERAGIETWRPAGQRLAGENSDATRPIAARGSSHRKND